MINSHLLYRLSYRGTAVRILLFIKGKSTLSLAQITCTMASVTWSRLLWFSAAAQMRPVPMA